MNETFQIVPAGSGPVWMLLLIGLITIPILLLFIYLASGSRTARFEVSPSGLRISGITYGRTIPASHLKPEDARIVDLTNHSELRPRLRTNGAGLPGLSAGWFKLANGQKALLFVTNRQRVVYLPTHRNYILLMSVEEPERFIASIQRIR